MRVDLEQSCWSADYLLAHCERYRVESNEGTLGYVEEVVWAPDGDELLALRVCGNQGHLTIMIGDVLELHPHGERIVVCSPIAQAEQMRQSNKSRHEDPQPELLRV